MTQSSLELSYTVNGIGAASGLYFHYGSLFLISDNGSHLFEYDSKKNLLQKTMIFDIGIDGNIPKKRKADFEAMAFFDNVLYIFGSGSTEKRKLLVAVQLDSKKIIHKHDLSQLYAAMRLKSGIHASEFNIEGAIFDGETWLFFQRGNGPSGQNGLFTISGNIFGNQFKVDYQALHLPEINGVRVTFTDAVAVGNQIYFIAAAENSASVYDDGEIMGSIIGRLNLKNTAVDFTIPLSSSHKFEGITLFEEIPGKIIFLLCEDNDGEATVSEIYKLTLDLQRINEI